MPSITPVDASRAPPTPGNTPTPEPAKPGWLATLQWIGNGLLDGVVSAAGTADTLRRALLRKPALALLGLSAVGNAVNAAPTARTAPAVRRTDGRYIGDQVAACIDARQRKGIDPALVAPACLGDVTYALALDRPFHPERFPSIGGKPPAAGTPGAAYVALAQRGMRMDVSMPGHHSNADIIYYAGSILLDTDAMARRIAAAAERVIDACDLRNQVDRDLFISSDVESVVDTMPCATDNIGGPMVRELSRAVDAVHFQTTMVANGTQYLHAKHDVSNLSPDARNVGTRFRQRVTDRIVSLIGI
ncbi:hypothetical protein [Stenotrophomonas sp. CFBP 13718]|uniref:hypothetical protein n=1 Tax=Stenotrophomonas sp. CFBP 13718 TaxID=2775304 RepID=UPI00177D1C15|nr:hypothetical protein [Stenotrophomonas sp. CFBP 13718]MBD8694693.1 hypothetical protein [Stenotrophomonas sp. CFBP 13718]